MTTATATQHPQTKSRDPHVVDEPLNGKDYIPITGPRRSFGCIPGTEKEYGPETIAPLPAELPDAVFETPTPAQIDLILSNYESAVREFGIVRDIVERQKERVIDLVKRHGYAPAHAEQSRRLEGALNTVTVTTGTTVTVNEPKVDELHLLLEERLGNSAALLVFQSFFTTRIKHELTAGAEDALRTMAAPKRTLQKIQAAFGQCISVKSKAPTVKIELRNKQPRVKKASAKKVVAK